VDSIARNMRHILDMPAAQASYDATVLIFQQYEKEVITLTMEMDAP
jgi:hypothetical protein